MAGEYSLPTQNDVPFQVNYGRFISRPIIDGLGATRTLLAIESGSLIIADRAAGIVLTLPAPVKGLNFKILVKTSITSNSLKVITDAGTTLLVGDVISNDTDSTGAAVFFSANGSTHIAITQNGTTTGGLVGTILRLTCVSATQWLIEGRVNGSGTVATPFATS